jgi:hypothetical protein
MDRNNFYHLNQKITNKLKNEIKFAKLLKNFSLRENVI